MEDCILKEIVRLQSMNLHPSAILINREVYEDIKARYQSMVRIYEVAPVPTDTFAGLRVVAIEGLQGGFQIAVENEIQSLRGVL